MKGNQGLDALAALCGGATKARVGDRSASGVASTLTRPVGGAVMAPAPTSDTSVSHAANVSGSTASSIHFTGNMTPVAGDAARNPSAVAGIPPQQWQQAVANAAAYGGTGSNAATAALLSAATTPNLPNGGGDASALNTMQQLAYYQYIQAHVAAAAAQTAQLGKAPVSPVAPVAPVQFVDPSKAAIASLALSVQPAENNLEAQMSHIEHHPAATVASMPKIIPGPSPTCIAPSNPSDNSAMQPPPPKSQVASVPSISTTGILHAAVASAAPPTGPASSKIVPLKPQPHEIAPQQSGTSTPASPPVSLEDKKQIKRAANRRSAQLSRKRKKLFIEELKEENDELRRKEQILRSIPDLIVVFDSAGKLWFVSHSVSRLLDFTPSELEGGSFWDRLCDESVRLLKAAFMDALAARKDGMDAAPLGSGVWELRLVDKDGSHKVVTLNGVVHFSGEAPECVCSIRSREEQRASQRKHARDETVQEAPVLTSSSSGPALHHHHGLIRSEIKPHQSVISNGSSDDSSGPRVKAGPVAVAARGGRRAMQISDDDSFISETGSDE